MAESIYDKLKSLAATPSKEEGREWFHKKLRPIFGSFSDVIMKNLPEEGDVSNAIAAPFIRFEVPTPSGGGGGVLPQHGGILWNYYKTSGAIKRLMNRLDKFKLPEKTFERLPETVKEEAFFVYPDKLLKESPMAQKKDFSKEPLSVYDYAKKVGNRFPDRLKILEFPDEIAKKAVYTDDAQAVVPNAELRKTVKVLNYSDVDKQISETLNQLRKLQQDRENWGK